MQLSFKFGDIFSIFLVILLRYPRTVLDVKPTYMLHFSNFSMFLVFLSSQLSIAAKYPWDPAIGGPAGSPYIQQATVLYGYPNLVSPILYHHLLKISMFQYPPLLEFTPFCYETWHLAPKNPVFKIPQTPFHRHLHRRLRLKPLKYAFFGKFLVFRAPRKQVILDPKIAIFRVSDPKYGQIDRKTLLFPSSSRFSPPPSLQDSPLRKPMLLGLPQQGQRSRVI